MGYYYKDTGSLRNMASAEAVLKRRMPKDIGILPIAELLLDRTDRIWNDVSPYPRFGYV